MATKILDVADVSVIRAAGGVVVRNSRSGEPEIAVIHRPEYDDWTLPKGKIEPDERPEDCALREVREETGLEVEIVRPIGVIDYWFAVPGERVHKLVHFFLMRPRGGDVSQHDHEYDDVRWVPVTEARRLLTYDTYREMLDRAVEAAREVA